MILRGTKTRPGEMPLGGRVVAVAVVAYTTVAMGCVRMLEERAEEVKADAAVPSDGDSGTPTDGPAVDLTSVDGGPDGGHGERVHDLAGCPPPCTSCAGGVCKYPCAQSTSPCVCPAGMACEFSCTDDNTCTQPITCGDGPCSVHCKAAGTCQGTIDCSSSSSCSVVCSGQQSCQGKITCGPGRCTVSCTNVGSCSQPIDCSGSCSCRVNCATACPGGVLCPPFCSDGCGQNDTCDSCP